MKLSITPGTNNVGAYINNIDLKNLNQNQVKNIKKWRQTPDPHMAHRAARRAPGDGSDLGRAPTVRGAPGGVPPGPDPGALPTFGREPRLCARRPP